MEINDEGNVDVAEPQLTAALQADPEDDGYLRRPRQPGPGAAAAVRTTGRQGKVQIMAFDFGMPVIELIDKSEIKATVGQNPYLMGFTPIRALLRRQISDQRALPLWPGPVCCRPGRYRRWISYTRKTCRCISRRPNSRGPNPGGFADFLCVTAGAECPAVTAVRRRQTKDPVWQPPPSHPRDHRDAQQAGRFARARLLAFDRPGRRRLPGPGAAAFPGSGEPDVAGHGHDLRPADGDGHDLDPYLGRHRPFGRLGARPDTRRRHDAAQ